MTFGNLPLRIGLLYTRILISKNMTTSFDPTFTLNCCVCGNEKCRISARIYDSTHDAYWNSSRYWNLAGNFRDPPWDIMSKSLCCQICEDVYLREVENAMGVTRLELDQADSPDHKSGYTRIHSALRAAYKRNETVYRRMRTSIAFDSFKILDAQTVIWIRKRVIEMLNIDLAVLLSCGDIVEIPRMRSTSLPPTFHKWRENERCYMHCLTLIRNSYHKYSSTHDNKIITSSHTAPRWISKARSAFVQSL